MILMSRVEGAVQAVINQIENEIKKVKKRKVVPRRLETRQEHQGVRATVFQSCATCGEVRGWHRIA